MCHGGILSALVGALTWSVIAEFLLLRTILRLGPVLPAKEGLLPVYQAVETAGLAAMNLAMLAATAVVVGLAGMLLAQRRAVAVLLGSLILAAVIANLALSLLLAVLPTATAVTLQAATLLAALLAIYAGGGGARRGRLALGLIASADTLALAYVLTPGLARVGLPLPGAGTVIFLAEAAALAAAIALPWSFHPQWQRRDLVVGVGLAIALLVAHTLRPSMLVAMTMWNLAFSLFLPGIVYAVAFGAFAATLLALRRDGQTGRKAATGLLLIALAGLKLDFTYFNLIALVGFLLCCQPLGVSARRGLLRSPTSIQ